MSSVMLQVPLPVLFFIYLMLFLEPALFMFLAHGLPLVFNYSNFDNGLKDVLQLQGGHTTSISRGVWLTPDPNLTRPDKENQTQGRLLYGHPLQFKSSNDAVNVSSFSTTFSFQIITPGAYGYCGDGLAFFISPSMEMPLESGGAFMGIANGTVLNRPERHLFAVEFDTYQNINLRDVSSSHIGININGLESLNVSDTSGDDPYDLLGANPELFLYSNQTFSAWVEYNASSQNIRVWATNTSTFGAERPSSTCVEAHYDLSTVFEKEMYIGFSASSGDSYEGHVIYSWDFSMEDMSMSAAPAPAPASSNNSRARPPDFQSDHSPLASAGSVAAHKSKRLTTLVAGSLCAVIAFALALAWAIFIVRRGSKGAPSQLPPVGIGHRASEGVRIPSNISVPCYRYKDLKRATNGFSDRNKKGEGASGDVYKATLLDGSIVAVKRLKDGLRKETEFLMEIGIISGIRHRNLLQLKGWCYDRGHALLVYDYMPNGSLDKYIFHNRGGQMSNFGVPQCVAKYLDSETRLGILKGVASALEYLHGGLGPCVLHRDVKAANVMLTERFEALVGDFGLARLITRNKAATMTAAGTMGYVAPEVLVTSKATDRADVYSFGVLALEVACSRARLDMMLPAQEMDLVDWVWELEQRRKIMDALDPWLVEEISDEGNRALGKWRCVLHVGLVSCHPFPESRPSMRQIYQSLEENIIIPLPTSQPALYPPPSANYPTSISSEEAAGASTLGLNHSSDGSLSANSFF